MRVRVEQVAETACDALIPILHDADEDDERIRATLIDGQRTTYAAYCEEQLVGAVTMRWGADESEIEYIAVDRSSRGKGYGKEIIAQVVELARQREVHALLVGTDNTAFDNFAFYQKCGFRMDHVRHDYFAYIQPPITQHGIVVRDMLVLRYELAVEL